MRKTQHTRLLTLLSASLLLLLASACGDTFDTADLGSTWMAGYPETISTAGNFDIQAAFDLPQVFIKLATQVRQAVVISGLEDNIPKNPDSIQNLYLKPLRRELSVRPTGRRPNRAACMARYLSGQ